MRRVLIPLFGTALLCALALLLGQQAVNVIRHEQTSPLPQATPAAALPTSARASAQTAAVRRPDVFYSAIVDRPLFAPTRRPVVEDDVEDVAVEAVVEEVAQDIQTPPPDDAVLAGVMGNSDNKSAFIVLDGADGVWMKLGETVAGWTITEIQANWVELSADDAKIRLELFQ